MGLKDKLNESPQIGFGIAVGFIVLAVVLIYLSTRSTAGERPDEAFFTIDDGKTWFADDVSKLPPFEKDGKQAVLAHVFSCDGKTFVNHLERMTPAGKKLAEDRSAALAGGRAPAPVSGSGVGVIREVKRPGAGEWVSQSDLSKAGPIMLVQCPGGSGTPEPVYP